MLKVVENGALREASWDLFELDQIALAGARGMLIAALQMEAADYVERHGDERDAEGRALVVHNGRSKGRKLTLGAGTVELKAPRLRRHDETAAFNRDANLGTRLQVQDIEQRGRHIRELRKISTPR